MIELKCKERKILKNNIRNKNGLMRLRKQNCKKKKKEKTE